MARVSQESRGEKGQMGEPTVHTEHRFNGNISAEDADFLANFSEADRKKVIRKIDWRLVPMLLILYLISFLDRANIGNAKIEGLLVSLHMDGSQYNIALAIYFIPYVLAEVPSNMILSKFKRPSVFMAIIVTTWGIVMTCHGFVRSFGGLVAVRALLGLFEAGFFPGAVLLISRWYLPNESQVRVALFFSASAMAGAFSGLLAYAIAMMNGIGGYEGWRWIFILEGVASVALGVLCYFALIDSPDLSAHWLTADEIRYLKVRQAARSTARPNALKEKTWDWRLLVSVLADFKIYLLCLVFWSNVVPNNALKFTMPQIMKNMGYTSSNAQLMTIPPYFVGACSAYLFALVADRFSWRMPFIVGPQLCVVIAYAILFSKAAEIKENIPACYFAVCLACFGMYPIAPGCNTWNFINLAGIMRRTIGIGYLLTIGNSGGIIGSFIFIEEESPKYPTGFGASFAFAAAGLLGALVLEFSLWTINKRDAKMTEAEVRAKYTDEQLEKMGDRSPLFKYTL